MAKTHFSGLAVGPPGAVITSNVQLAQSVTLTAASPANAKFNFATPVLIVGVAILNTSTGAPLAATTVKIGTTAGGTEVYTTATFVVTNVVAIAPKKVTGTVYAEIAGPSFPATVILQVIPLD